MQLICIRVEVKAVGGVDFMRASGEILVVDGDPESLELLTDALAGEGYQVRPAISGELALASIAVQPPELILLDVQMPGIDGFEVCRRLKAGEKTRDVPLIFISAAAAVEECVEGLSVGAVDFIVKPFRREELVARVRTHLELGRLRIELGKQVAQRTAELRAAVERLQIEVAERRRAELAVRESDELTRLAMEAGRTYVFEWNPANDEVRRSHNYTEILGISGDAIRDTRAGFIQRVYVDDREKFARMLAELTPVNDKGECEFRVAGSDGRTIYLRSSIRALFDSGGRLTRCIGIVADITRTTQAEAALHESEERFRNMADTAPVMICASGPDKLATFFNKAWLAFTGRTLEQELGYGWTRGVHPDDLDRCIAACSSSFDARRKCHIEYRLLRADGEYRWIVFSGVPRFMPDAVFSGYIASCIDITDLKRAQEDAFDKQKLESLRVLTGGIAHDFNNLLGGILVEAEVAETDLAEGSSPLEGIRRIRVVALRAAEIVRELMIYSGQDKATLKSLHVSRLVEDMLELLKVSISKHALLQTDLANQLPAVLGNAAQICQVVMNLIINASEAIGEKHGTIRVTTSKVTECEDWNPDRATTLPEGDYVRLEVADTGCGMTEEARARIFDPFFTTKTNGHGLGLAVVQGIVRSHGGAINVTSTPGRGTTFEVLLPSAGELAGSAVFVGSAAVPEGFCTASETVLLVEDEDTLRVAIAKALRRRGFSVLSAADGHAGIEVFQAHTKDIDVVLLDLTLPGISGLEVLEQIRLTNPTVRVILTSAYGRESRGGAGDGDHAAVTFLRKPYRVGELVRMLRQGGPAPAVRDEALPDLRSSDGREIFCNRQETPASTKTPS
jgi:two-component system cell cycle sensor histidine kinase/response regulator CckA